MIKEAKFLCGFAHVFYLYLLTLYQEGEIFAWLGMFKIINNFHTVFHIFT